MNDINYIKKKKRKKKKKKGIEWMNNFQLVIGLNRVSRTTDGEGFIDKSLFSFCLAEVNDWPS